MKTRQERLHALASKTQSAAHSRVVKDGTVQFRLDADNMEHLLKLADERGTGVGVLARMWVLERLSKESNYTEAVLSEFITATKQMAELQAKMNTLSKEMQNMLNKKTKAG